ncbi:MAG: L,D-transpeptidase [Hyphomicrobium sp.]|nr:L,D-transpeptidase [Hyphomicrobium sp.]
MRIHRLLVVMAVWAAGALTGSGSTLAQGGWSDQGPVFPSDVKQREDQAEAERAARRASYPPVVYPKYMEGGERPDIKPAEPPTVYLANNEAPGSIIIDTDARTLYYVLPGKKAYAYPISVGREGFTWTGTERISRIAEWPSWTPPKEMHERVPGLPLTVTGGLKNPQGARALYLGNTVYRIHGTNNDRTVGRANSSGCFRLTNEHVVHLASIAKVGAKVQVLKSYAGASENLPLSSLFGFFGSEEPQQKPAKPEKKKSTKPAAKKMPATAVAVGEPAAGPTPRKAAAASGNAVLPAASVAATSATQPATTPGTTSVAQSPAPDTDALAAAKAAAAEAKAAAEEAKAAAAAAKKAASGAMP